MTNLFTAKKLSVPGLLDDTALQEQLKQFGDSRAAEHKLAPPPAAATDMADRVAREYISAPSARAAREMPKSPVPRSPADRSPVERAIIGSPIGPLGLLGPGLLMAEQFGTLDAEERQVEADARAEAARDQETAFRNKAALRAQLRDMPSEDAARIGLPVPPAPITEGEKEVLRQQDEAIVGSAAAKTKDAEAAVKDPAKQPTQTWWLNAAQVGVRSAAEMGVSMAKLPPIIWEQYEAAITGSSEKSLPREWLDKVDTALTQMLPGDKARSKDFVTQLASGTGSMAAFMVAGYLGAAVGLPVGLSTGALGAATEGVQLYEEAEQFDATGLQKFLTLLAGAALGVTEAIPIDRMFMRVDVANGGIVRRLLKTTAAGSLEEFIQETSQAVGEDVVAKYLYDEERKFDLKEYAQRGLVGAITGGIASGGVGAIAEIAGDSDVTTPTAEREAIVNTAVAELQNRFEALVGEAEGTAGVAAGVDIALPMPTAEFDTMLAPKDPVVPEIVELPSGTIEARLGGAVVELSETDGLIEIVDLRTSPAERGRGLASDLMRFVARRADAAGATTRLMALPDDDTDMRRLLRFYERYGFSETGEVDDGGIVMERQPAAGAAPAMTAFRGGSLPTNEDGLVELTHWSDRPLDVIDPARRGTGPLVGEERRRLGAPGADPMGLDFSTTIPAPVNNTSFNDSVVQHPVFHGTDADLFDNFDMGMLGSNSDHPSTMLGMFFTSNRDVASIFGSRIETAQINLTNPLTVSGLNFFNMTRQSRLYADIRRDMEALKARALEGGHDGLHITPIKNPSGETAEWAGETYVVFDAAQIRRITPETDAMATASRRGRYEGEQGRPGAGVPERPSATPGVDGENDINLSRMSRNFVRLLNLTARQGRLTLKGSQIMGQYSRRSAVVRLRTWGDLSTLVHEGAHAFHDSMSPLLKAFVDRNANDFMDVGTQLYAGDLTYVPKDQHVREGFAEFFRVYTLNRQFVDNKYPRLTAEFTALLEAEAPQVKAGLDLLGAQFAAWLQLPSTQLLRNMVEPGIKATGINAAIKELRDVGFGAWYAEAVNQLVSTSLNRYDSMNRLVSDMLNAGEANQGRAIDLKRADDPRVLIRLARNTGGRAMVQLTDGVYAYRGLQPTTRSLRDALLVSQGVDPTKSPRSLDQTRLQDFDTYLVALRSIDEYRRMQEGKIERPPVAATLGDVQQTARDLEAKYGTAFTEAATIVHEYGMALWKKQFDAGLMTKETYLDGLERRFYAPLQRDMSDKNNLSLGPGSLFGGRSIVKRFRGSDRNIISPMTTLMHKTFALERIIAQNDTLKAMALLSDRAGKAGAFVERVPSSVLTAKTFTVKEVARQLTKDDSLSETDAQDLMTLLEASIEDGSTIKLFRPEQASTYGENVLFYWEGGKLAAIQLKDGSIGADIVNMFNGLGRENMHVALEMIAMTSSAFRSAITAWPDFLLVNFIRDQMSAWIINDVGFKPFVTSLQGVGDELRQTQWSKMYNAAMGIMGGMNVATLHDARVARDLGALRGKGYIAKAFNDGGLPGAIKGMARVVELAETGTRLGIFRKAYERAKADGLSDWEAGIEASYTATDYIDFGLNGSRMLAARRTIPFLNAQLQSLYKMMRTLGADEVRQRKGLRFVLKAFFKDVRGLELSRTEQQAVITGRKAWIKMVSLGLLSAALHFLFEDDPDYQEAGEYLRTTGWVIPLGDGRIFYIPKPFELALVANAVERGLESAAGDPEAKKRFLRGLAMTMTPPSAPPAIQMLVEYAANKDFFTGREIVPDYMQALQPQLQYNNYTSDLAKRIGEITGWSPMVLDHFMSGLGASAYRDMVAMTNALNPNRPSMDETDAPILRRFVRDVRRGSASAQDFWAQASMVSGRLRVAEVTYKSLIEGGNPVAANKFLADLPEDERAYALLNANFKAEAKRLNPFYRGRQITTIVSAMRRELASDLGLENTQPYGDPIKLTAREKAEIDEVLSEYARREIRNTLVATATPGWSGKKQIDAASTLALLEAVEPRVRAELARRMTKAKVYDAAVVFEYWPEVKDRVLRDKEAAFLDDIVTIAKVMKQ